MSYNAADKFEGARYNNLIDGLMANPYKYSFQHFGTTRQIQIQQFPSFGIGGVLWDCELILAEYLKSKKNCNRWNGATMIELGSGAALGGIVAWQLGATAIVTDLQEVVEICTAPNVEINTTDCDKKRRSQLSAQVLSWGNVDEGEQILKSIPVSELQKCSQGKGAGKKGKGGAKASAAAASSEPIQARFDYIIAADVIYRSEDHAPLMETILQLAHPETTFIFVHRVRFSNDGNFLDPVKEAFDIVSATPVADIYPKYPKSNLTVYEFKLKTKKDGGGEKNKKDEKK